MNFSATRPRLFKKVSFFSNRDNHRKTSFNGGKTLLPSVNIVNDLLEALKVMKNDGGDFEAKNL